MRKLGRVAEAAIAFVEHLDGGFYNRLDHLGRHLAAASGKRIGLCDGVGDQVGLLDGLAIFFAIGLRNGSQHALEAWTAVLILRWEVGAAVEGLAVGGEKAGEGPAALSGEGTDGDLIAGVDVGTFVAVDFYGD